MLTSHQQAILKMRAEGLSVSEVAGRLDISDQTVKNHIANAYARLEVTNMAEAFLVLGWLRIPGEARTPCGFVARCGRPAGHRGHHGGFRAVE